MTMANTGKKTDNRARSLPAKVKLREEALEFVKPAHVFDGYCGLPDAPMSAVWSKAASYLGCDTRYQWPDPRARFVGDTTRVLRAIDLAPFNVFDFDPYGSPWTALAILADRRTWAPAERGALVLTDGSSLATRMGTVPLGMRHLLGGMRHCPPKDRAMALHRECISAWARRSGVVVKKSKSATAVGKPAGATRMVYSLTLFEGG